MTNLLLYIDDLIKTSELNAVVSKWLSGLHVYHSPGYTHLDPILYRNCVETKIGHMTDLICQIQA